jgi:quaternary ammonium compound-resistance protein SugE
MGWVYLLLAGLFEIGFTTSMRYLDWPPRLGPLVVFVVFASASFACLMIAVKTLPVGTAYAVWTGIGAAGTALIGMAWYGELVSTARLVLIVVLIGAIAGLKLIDG